MVREIKESELLLLLDLYKHLNPQDDPLPYMPRVEEIWHTIMRDPSIRYFAYELDGRLLSSCHLVIIPNLTRGCRPYGLIENVVTHADFRHQGMGTAVLQHALSYAWNAGCYKVMLLSGSNKEWVHEFYEKAGFRKGIKTGFDARPQVTGG